VDRRWHGGNTMQFAFSCNLILGSSEVAFLSWSLACGASFFAIKSQVQTLGGRIGLGFLLAISVSLAMAALFSSGLISRGRRLRIHLPCAMRDRILV